MNPTHAVLILTGLSGAGKTTVAQQLVLRYHGHYTKVVTCTTRAQRKGENDGVDYHFLSRERFLKLIEQDEMLEWKEHYGNLYGTRRSEVETHAPVRILVMDVKGAKEMKQKIPEATVVFITCNTEMLISRIQQRGSVNNLDERLRALEDEETFEDSKYVDNVIINDDGTLEVNIERIHRLFS